MTVAKEPGHRGEHEAAVKTIARGMPGCSGVTVVTNARVYYTPRAAAGASAPGIPCALFIERAGCSEQTSRKTCGEIVNPWLFEIEIRVARVERPGGAKRHRRCPALEKSSETAGVDRSRARAAAGFDDLFAAIDRRAAVVAVMAAAIMQIGLRRYRSPRAIADDGGWLA
jgi:hypothetical protein